MVRPNKKLWGKRGREGMAERREERKRGEGRGNTLKKFGLLTPAEEVCCRTQTLLQDVEQFRCTCTNPERGEAEERERQRRR
jgi:hypothetical protein